jgi:hypothetical protein
LTPDEIIEVRKTLGLSAWGAAPFFGIERRRWRRIEGGRILPFNTLERLIAVALVPGVREILDAMTAEQNAYAAAHPAPADTGEDEDDER